MQVPLQHSDVIAFENCLRQPGYETRHARRRAASPAPRGTFGILELSMIDTQDDSVR